MILACLAYRLGIDRLAIIQQLRRHPRYGISFKNAQKSGEISENVRNVSNWLNRRWAVIIRETSRTFWVILQYSSTRQLRHIKGGHNR
jgi:uncharacterized protein YqjF (DUF2071 family)